MTTCRSGPAPASARRVPGQRAPGWSVAPCRGYTIAEFLIAGAIGLLIVLAASMLLVSAKAVYTGQTEQARVQDAGRFAIEHIARVVRQSAYRDAADIDDTERAAPVAGLDSHTMKDVDAALEAALPVAGKGSDILALFFSDGGGGAINCAGLQASGDAADHSGASLFYVAVDGAGEAELRCKYHGAHRWSSDALVRGVDSLQVLYGVDSDSPPDGLPNRFMTATAINAVDAALLLDGASAAARERDRNRQTLWKRVVAVKVALLLHGAQNLAQDGPAIRQYDLFGAQYSSLAGARDAGTLLRDSDFADAVRRRYRQIFTATIALRNR